MDTPAKNNEVQDESSATGIEGLKLSGEYADEDE